MILLRNYLLINLRLIKIFFALALFLSLFMLFLLFLYRLSCNEMVDTQSSMESLGGSICDEPCNTSKCTLPNYSNTDHKLYNTQSCVRKMSIMPEEEDIVSDDTDPDVIKITHQHSHSYQKRPETESDWSLEEKDRLLDSTNRKFVITPTEIDNDGLKKTASRNGNSDNIQNRTRWPQLRLIDQIESKSSSSNDNGYYSPGRLTRNDQHAIRNCQYPSVRSLKSNVIMDEDQQHHRHCYHHSPTTTWASMLFAESNGGQSRSFPDSISIKSLASIGLGSSDGRKIMIRRVPTSPSELLNMVHPPP